jgi:pimeloyl-ACP methyl ester carboxylesterase
LAKFLLALCALLLLALLGVYFARPDWLVEAEYARLAWRAGEQKHTLEAAGHRIVYYDGGSGDPIVLVHGFTGSKENWLELARHLTPHHRVLIPDLPGWGESERKAGADYGVAAQVERLGALLDALGLARAHLVGHSMAGQITGVFTAAHPERVLSLALVDSAGVHFKPNAFAERVLAGATPFNFSSREEFWSFAHELFEQPPWLPPRVVDVLVERNLSGHAFHAALLRELAQGPDADLLERSLAAIKTPTLVLWCRDDRLLDVSSVDKIKAGLVTAPRVEITLLDRCSHMPMMERPSAVAAALGEFLATLK